MRRGRRAGTGAPKRSIDYRRLRNPFPPMELFSTDEVQALHQASLDLLKHKGIKVLLPEACAVFEQAGARLRGDMVFLDEDIVGAALKSAPQRIELSAGARDRDLTLELGNLVFQPGAGAPHATDLTRGRRPGDLKSFRELIALTHNFDVLHMLPPLVEPQDVPIHTRHYATLEAQMELSDKFPFIFARGTSQVEQSFELLRDFRGLSDNGFKSGVHAYTIINTNSPRQLDIPMSQGLIDFARHNQVAIVTPFTLMGAMAPITVGGALTLSHAEALAAITLTQLVKPGAPVCYGTFTSNVDMKSGAPAFGTPEHFRASVLAGQLARHIGLPWRSASGSAANISDVQAAHETQMGLWGCLMGGATVVIHAAGWLEGGLTVSYEKLVTDCEVLQMVAELCTAPSKDLGLDALEEVAPGGHFFGAAHTMARYQTEFYEPLVADWSNYGTWSERGARDATTRATDIWQSILAEPGFVPDGDRVDAMANTIRRMEAAGGAPPES
ncbi:trimethylamine methyltransferase family protein [Pseudaestuariivita sp.]|uniref:trimethylamine methyltransferase family protein n=1 Tax=Pseudaestuariivita sp. TaxID=2211669 RepID=UPI00405A1682